jgi:hypothetical protein
LSFREWVERLRANGRLTEAKTSLSRNLQVAAFKELESRAP